MVAGGGGREGRGHSNPINLLWKAEHNTVRTLSQCITRNK